jgi:hypothetical protein
VPAEWQAGRSLSLLDFVGSSIEKRRTSMNIREKLDEALKDLSVADEEMLDAF